MRVILLFVSLVLIVLPSHNAIAKDRIACEDTLHTTEPVLVEVNGGDAILHDDLRAVRTLATTDAYQTLERYIAEGYVCTRVRIPE